MSEEQENLEVTPEQVADQQPQPERTFTQSDVDRIVQERLAADRRSRDLTPDQVTELKSKAEAAEKALADALKVKETAERDALVARLQRDHSISDEDAAIFLTASTPDDLKTQAERLSSYVKPEPKPVFGNPKVGGNPEPPADEEREFVRRLTNRSGS